jgi:hypothetical protein
VSDETLDKTFAPLVRQWWSGVDVMPLATALGVAAYALDELRVGWDGLAWTMPERNAAGLYVGISRRFPDGSKKCVIGSHRGLIYSDGWHDATGPVLIVEGASDVATAITMGFSAIGRPSNTGGAMYLVQLLRTTCRLIVVLGENDQKENGLWPGKDGAETVAAQLRKRIRGPRIHIRYPLDGAKDLRSWFNEKCKDPENQRAAYRLGASFLRRLFIREGKP